ncbi:DNA ligase [Paraburkholderia sp. A1RI-2L]|uniref:ATP-dependent DNA ligase n=1 Tax=Paraburkholderia sp. A1RI-2L TaxID=3028367 RepID=UPI003B770884
MPILIDSRDLMLATLRRRAFSDKDWLFQWKYDGYRCLVKKQRERGVELVSREGKSLNRSFPEVVAAVAALPGDFVWDSELAVGGARGEEAFAQLQQRARTNSPKSVPAAVRRCPARIFVFDMLVSEGVDLRGKPLVERKEMLRDSFEDTSTLVYVTDVEGVGELAFEQAQLHDFEGIVAKRKASTYVRGRSLNWIKVKNGSYTRRAALGFGASAKGG